MPAPETKSGSALRGLSPGGLNPAPADPSQPTAESSAVGLRFAAEPPQSPQPAARRLTRRASWPRPGSRAPSAPEPASAEKMGGSRGERDGPRTPRAPLPLPPFVTHPFLERTQRAAERRPDLRSPRVRPHTVNDNVTHYRCSRAGATFAGAACAVAAADSAIGVFRRFRRRERPLPPASARAAGARHPHTIALQGRVRRDIRYRCACFGAQARGVGSGPPVRVKPRQRRCEDEDSSTSDSSPLSPPAR